MKNRDFLTLARFASMEEAQVVKTMLDSMGLQSELIHDTAADVLPVLEGDIKLIVNAADIEKAKDLLKAKFDKQVFKTAWMMEEGEEI